MDNNLKEILKIAKNLHKKELVYLHDSINLQVEPNYQLLCSIVEELNLTMNKEAYELIKESQDELINELALLAFNEDALVSKEDIGFMGTIIKEFIDIDNPMLIDNTYVFTIQFDKLQELYDKALKQIGEGKFKNFIF